MKPVIETHALCKSYHGRPVVDHLNLTVPEGCVYGFLGPNVLFAKYFSCYSWGNCVQ